MTDDLVRHLPDFTVTIEDWCRFDLSYCNLYQKSYLLDDCLP